MKDIKFLKKGIRSRGEYIPVWYKKGGYTKKSGLSDDTITVYAKKYNKPLPKELAVENDSDIMTDYFEKDRARIRPGSKFYPDVSKFFK